MIARRLASSLAVSSSHPAAFRLPPNIRQLLDSPPLENDPNTTTVAGWVKSIRKQKNVSFAVITDGSSSKGLQTVLLKAKGEEGMAKNLTNGTAVRITGRLVASPGAGQAHELLVDEDKDGEIEVLGECDPETYPIQKQSLSTEYLREHTHLRARTAHIAAMVRLRNQLSGGIENWFKNQGFCYAHTPILTTNDAEGAGEAFRIAAVETVHPASRTTEALKSVHEEFFSRPAFLTVSHQLHLEALATALSRVYTLSPCFRAEPSLTARHLAEFWMLEAEWAFTGHSYTPSQTTQSTSTSSLEEICAFVEGLLRNVVGPLVRDGLSDTDVCLLWKDGDAQKRRFLKAAFASDTPWTRMTYSDAISALSSPADKATRFEYPVVWGKPLQSEHERWLAETLVGGPVFVTDYPSALKPFYMRANDDGKTVACFDLLVPHMGELAGGSVREERRDILQQRMREAGLDIEGHGGEDEGGYRWYEELRRWGGAPHAGFGMGFERLIGWVGGVENVRECIPMPRWAGRMLL
ncbi:hypothetical protein BDQ12DRAFT_680374 [Crucibulum laeve]|uniref:asparagine--tRNA ligase n=1 Tax=Crucibulum laeve TaxID=68775 RepID=A0A5C3MG22_9AGAR|nr:hypothetical protein BDQ12DRAFT_680374 [Crucibulum laeve]